MVPGITHLFLQTYMMQYFKLYIRNKKTERYNIMCYINAHEKKQP